MKKVIIFILVVLVAVAGLMWKRSETNQPAVNNAEWQTYADPEGVFTFEYLDVWQVSGRQGPVVAKVNVPKSYLPQTNFSGAELAIEWTGGGTDASCSDKTESTEGAAGSRYETTAYEKLYDGDCYTFTYTIRSANLGNYDPNLGLEEFDKDKIQGELDRVVESFDFLVNSD